jgi:predicted metalloprotease
VKWKRLPRGGGNIEDRRGAPGIGGGIPIGVGGGGLGILVLLLVTLLTGNFPGTGGDGASGSPFDPLPEAQAPSAAPDPATDPDATLAEFTKVVHTDIERMWTDLFRRAGRDYRPSTLVLFTQGTTSACGGASASVGPHYCPRDNRVYIDLEFFRELQDRFGAPGDFAQAYVIAHEVGHHVQNVLALMDRVQNREDSVRLELQADCLAGVWAKTAEDRQLLDPGDTEEALGAAAAVGDDRIQQRTQGRVDPESFTHGSSEQRMKWFTRGMRDGDSAACDTFSGEL